MDGGSSLLAVCSILAPARSACAQHFSRFPLRARVGGRWGGVHPRQPVRLEARHPISRPRESRQRARGVFLPARRPAIGVKSNRRAPFPSRFDCAVTPATETRPPSRKGPLSARQRWVCAPVSLFLPVGAFWLADVLFKKPKRARGAEPAAAACGGCRTEGRPCAGPTAGATENDQ